MNKIIKQRIDKAMNQYNQH